MAIGSINLAHRGQPVCRISLSWSSSSSAGYLRRALATVRHLSRHPEPDASRTKSIDHTWPHALGSPRRSRSAAIPCHRTAVHHHPDGAMQAMDMLVIDPHIGTPQHSAASGKQDSQSIGPCVGFGQLIVQIGALPTRFGADSAVRPRPLPEEIENPLSDKRLFSLRLLLGTALPHGHGRVPVQQAEALPTDQYPALEASHSKEMLASAMAMLIHLQNLNIPTSKFFQCRLCYRKPTDE